MPGKDPIRDTLSRTDFSKVAEIAGRLALSFTMVICLAPRSSDTSWKGSWLLDMLLKNGQGQVRVMHWMFVKNKWIGKGSGNTSLCGGFAFSLVF